ncbi:hypothetical protein L596_026805 [Steinernema carpocapsae]|uniref:Uncharacterized protein n=1 Tax=Steinernema carpocapsae TaxID=34508 RepID=A0A4U5M3D7_STECR|nr:hypothetical protein L596_026805 [Steinernema carpocapsae]
MTIISHNNHNIQALECFDSFLHKFVLNRKVGCISLLRACLGRKDLGPCKSSALPAVCISLPDIFTVRGYFRIMFTACFKNMEPQKFVGKAVIVTGSSSGIGQGIALLLAQQGASVTIHGRSMEGLKETLKQINDCGVNADKIHMVRGNITDPSVQDKLVDETVQKFGRLDVVVNNAGMMSKPGAKDAFDNFDFLVNVLVKSIIRINELALPHLEKTKGNIVNMSSIGALKVFSGNEHYCMLKASLDHYMRFQAQALASKGIRMNNLN